MAFRVGRGAVLAASPVFLCAASSIAIAQAASVAAPTGGASESLFSDGFEGEAGRGELRFSTATLDAGEAGGPVTITIQRVNGSAGAIGVHFASADGSATAPGDYASVAGSLAWADGDATPKTFTITPVDDARVEGPETILLALDTPTGGAALGAPAQATLTFADDDPPCVMAAERDVTVAGMVSDRFTWCDAAQQPRVAVLAHNDGQTGPGGVKGGALREFRFQIPGGTRVVPVTSDGNAGQGGFGYVVSHAAVDGAGHVIPCSTGVANDSPLGDFFAGAFTRVFEGRHHALFRFTVDYPRYGCEMPDTPTQTYSMPVTIEWLFTTGRDNPLWTITYDLSAIPSGAVTADSRSPYGELNFDGTPTGGTHSTIAGVAWGERYKFESTTDPVSYQSSWTWNELNSVPWVKLWTTTVDATMGVVQTQTMSQQDAGGYYGYHHWRLTSADGPACGPSAIMPCNSNWPFQSINYALGVPTGTTTVTRLAWGTNFGFLGQESYPVMGSVCCGIGGPVGNGNPTNNPYANEAQTAEGYPRRSYSTFVVLGRHSADPVGAQVAQVETVQHTVLTATIGTVRPSGPAGVNRPDSTTYAPVGWNHVYAAWAIDAVGNRVDANFAVDSGTLSKPLLIVSNWTSQSAPSNVKLDGAALVPDVDYFASVRVGAGELWITLDRDLVGSSNRLEIAQ